MNVSLDTLHNSEWSEFLYLCRPLLYIPTNMHLPSCAFPYQTMSKLLQVVCTIHVMLSQFGLFTVYMFYKLFLFSFVFCISDVPSPKCFLILKKNKIRVNFFQPCSCLYSSSFTVQFFFFALQKVLVTTLFVNDYILSPCNLNIDLMSLLIFALFH